MIVNRLAPPGHTTLRTVLVLMHFLLSVLMVEWAIVLAFLLRSLRLSWRSHVAVISFGFGVYSAALLAGGGYFTTGREMRDYVFFSYFRIVVYLLICGLLGDQPCGSRSLVLWAAKATTAIAFEVRVVRTHVDESLLMDGENHRIDPDKWRPLIMSFCKFYGLGEQVWQSTLAEIAEAAYRPVPQMTRYA